MVSVGRAVGIRGNHFTHGDGKLAFSRSPSEIVIPPAAFLASRGKIKHIAVVIAAGTFGSWLGATVDLLGCLDGLDASSSLALRALFSAQRA